MSDIDLLHCRPTADSTINQNNHLLIKLKRVKKNNWIKSGLHNAYFKSLSSKLMASLQLGLDAVIYCYFKDAFKNLIFAPTQRLDFFFKISLFIQFTTRFLDFPQLLM